MACIYVDSVKHMRLVGAIDSGVPSRPGALRGLSRRMEDRPLRSTPSAWGDPCTAGVSACRRHEILTDLE